MSKRTQILCTSTVGSGNVILKSLLYLSCFWQNILKLDVLPHILLFITDCQLHEQLSWSEHLSELKCVSQHQSVRVVSRVALYGLTIAGLFLKYITSCGCNFFEAYMHIIDINRDYLKHRWL